MPDTIAEHPYHPPHDPDADKPGWYKRIPRRLDQRPPHLGLRTMVVSHEPGSDLIVHVICDVCGWEAEGSFEDVRAAHWAQRPYRRGRYA